MTFRTRAIIAILLTLLTTTATITMIFILQSPGSTVKIGERQIILSQKGLFEPTFSPDGNSIVYTSNRSGDFDIWMMKIDGRHEVRLTSLKGDEVKPKFSPDGTKLAFLNENNDNISLYVIGLLSSDSVLLSKHKSMTGMSWSHDGSKLLYVASDGGPYQIFYYSLSELVEKRHTTTEMDCFDPSWSIDDESILFVASNPYINQLRTLSLSEGEERVVLNTSRQMSFPRFIFSGSSISYLLKNEGRWSLWMLDLINGEEYDGLLPNSKLPAPTSETPNVDSMIEPMWNANQSMVIFAAKTPSGLSRAYVTKFNQTIFIEIGESMIWTKGPLLTKLQLDENVTLQSFDWSPDSKQVLLLVFDGRMYSIVLIAFVPITPVPRSYG